ncbi:MAG TPA: CocE/NonD family hydrolase [Pseudonocardia sp.]|uniref:CocE/NonD family hydrolase n=1 Tax=Pseudonocardia sp. TaxID=60912 RepID=UPI002EDB39C2
MIPPPAARRRPGPPRLLALLVAAVACATACSGPPPAPSAPAWPPTGGRGSCAVSKTSDVGVPMRDGTVLRADVYRPTSAEPVPVILYRTQYNKALAQIQPARYQSPDWFASHCYLVVTEDIRGMYASAGTFSEYTDDQNDGYDSVEWAARLPGSNGKVGMYGSSYVGATQWLAAEAAPPHLVTIIPSNTSADYYQGWTYEDGAFRLNFIEPWVMGLAQAAAKQRGDQASAEALGRERSNMRSWLGFAPYQRLPPLQPDNPVVAGYFFDWLRNRTDGAYWDRWAPRRFYPKISIPVLNMEGWYDGFLAGGVQNFTGMVASAGSPFARANQRLVIGPYDYLGWGRPESPEPPLLKQIGPIANSPINDLMIAWWDHYLKGVDNGVGSGGPRVDYFRMGSDTWQTTSAWPLPGTQTTPYYLASAGHANTAGGDGTLSTSPPTPTDPADHYHYDPADPVHSVGGHSCCSVGGVGSQGPYDQREVEQRPDVLTYTTDALTQDTEVTGPISLTLFAASSAPDTDWTAKLVVVHPDGTAVNLNNGIQRASYRDSLSKPSPITPGRVYKYTINIWPTSNLFAAGDRIRLEVSSSDFPQFDPNPNTGDWLGDSTRTQPADQTVLHDAAHPSALLLPVIPEPVEPSTLPAAPTH